MLGQPNIFFVMMESESVEEYLEAIYKCNERGEAARTTELAEQLNISPPSVTEMIKRLANVGFVEYEPYKGAILTGKGMALAQKVVRKHRLLECFLQNILGINREKVHDEACKLEHSLSDEASAALCKVLDAPKTCSDDGKTIPPCPLDVTNCEQCTDTRKKESESPALVTQLSNLKPKEEGVVAFIKSGHKACQRLLDMGLTCGTRIRVVNAAPFHGPMELEVRGTTLAIGRSLAGRVFVKIDENHSAYKRINSHLLQKS
ncbi:MAG: DtxR family iron (Metal) dependent repressor [Thermoproteota archaeon]|nr:DtxR family iron (Metal) dependent repressor [Thermoproteota archaeon]